MLAQFIDFRLFLFLYALSSLEDFVLFIIWS